MSLDLYIYLAVAPLIILSMASVIYAVMYRFYLNSHHGDVNANVTIIMAMTGVSENFANLLTKLNSQIVKPSKLLIGVESESDPGYRKILDLRSSVDFPIEISIAGLATDCSQKSHNLLSAFSLIDNGKDTGNYIVLCDADINPPVWWLSALIKPLINKKADLVTGYRWQQTQSMGLWANLIVFLDRKIALLPRPESAQLIWGGSVSMTNIVFQSILKSGVLSKTLSDDLTIGSYSYLKGFKVLHRRLLLVPSLAPQGLRAAWSFGVRQYKIIKIYRPIVWVLAFLGALLRVVGWFLVIYLSLIKPVYIFVIAFLYILSLLQVFIEMKITELLNLKENRQGWIYQYSLILIRPCIDLFQFFIIMASVFSNRISWSHVDYLIDSPGSVRVSMRRDC